MMKTKINMNWIKTRNNVSVTLFAYLRLFYFFGPLISLLKYKKNMSRSFVFHKSTEINPPPHVFLSFNEANGSELWLTSGVFLLSSSKIAFCCKKIAFFYLIPGLFLEIQMTGVTQKWFHVQAFPNISPLIHKPTKKFLWLCINPMLIFGVLRYYLNPNDKWLNIVKNNA